MPDATNPREIEALVERLRYATRRVYSGDVMHQAADAIESLLEQRKRVLVLCNEVAAETKCPARECTCYLGTINALLAAIRAALEEPCKPTNS